MMELEQKIMAEIGFGQNYNYSNGSRSCRYIREEALKKLPAKLKNEKLSISIGWEKILSLAMLADNICDEGCGYLTNTWIACSYAIQDAIYKAAGNSIRPTCKFFIFETPRQAKNFELFLQSKKRKRVKKYFFHSEKFLDFMVQKRGSKILFPSQ